MAKRAKRIIVSGRVQGVGFRYFVRQAADRLGLTGNVSNLPDSTVEIIVEGDQDVIAQFLAHVRKGPSLSRVDRLEVAELRSPAGYRTFQIEGW